MDRYTYMFGSVERTVDFIIDSCAMDCYVCPFPCSIPCFKEFGCDIEDLKQEITEWLKGDSISWEIR